MRRVAALVLLAFLASACAVTPMGGPIPAIAIDPIPVRAPGSTVTVDYTSAPFESWERADVAGTVREALAQARAASKLRPADPGSAIGNAKLTWTSSNELRVQGESCDLAPHEER